MVNMGGTFQSDPDTKRMEQDTVSPASLSVFQRQTIYRDYGRYIANSKVD